MIKLIPQALALALLSTACAISPPGAAEPTAVPGTRAMGMGMGQGMGMGMGMGRQSGMMARHSAPIPEEYAGITNPTVADEASLDRGAEIFVTHCATCHGDGGMGDGPGGAALDPVPAPVAHTSQMMGDDYLFWRISEGGAMAPFNSAMPSWKEVLEEPDRWDVINYVRALGSGDVIPRQGAGGAALDPGAQATRQADMLAIAIAQGVLSLAEADEFAIVHSAIETEQVQVTASLSGDPATRQAEILAALVQDGTITQQQADSFTDAHARLLNAGLMD